MDLYLILYLIDIFNTFINFVYSWLTVLSEGIVDILSNQACFSYATVADKHYFDSLYTFLFKCCWC